MPPVVRHALLLAALALAVPSLALADPPRSGIVHVGVPPGTPPVEHGYQLYAGNCVMCHGNDGRGVYTPRNAGSDAQTELGPKLRGVGAIAADLYLRTGYMPLRSAYVQPRRSSVLFSDREIRALVAYVASLGPGPPIPDPHPERGAVGDGLRLFTRHCAGCHQINAEGGYVVGGVAPPVEEATPVQIAEAIRVGPYLMPSFAPKQLSDADVNSIIRYVQHTKDPDDRGGWAIGHVGPVPEGLVTWLIAMVVLVAICLVIGERRRS
jgi:ubiquinol-cytochrome c reductase cytochrome c subunit